MPDPHRSLLMDAAAVGRALARMAREIVEINSGTDNLVIMGIRRRGDALAGLLGQEIERAEGHAPAIGAIDITLYRDDLAVIGPRPVIGETEIPPHIEPVDGRYLL